MTLSTVLAATLLSCVHLAAAADVSFYGCYSNGGNLTDKQVSTSVFQSSGYCRVNCTTIQLPDNLGTGYNVQGMTKGDECFCSLTLPWHGYKVDDTKCSAKCGGFPDDSCGSRLGDYWSVYLTGLEPANAISEDPQPTSSSTASASKTTLINTTDPSKPSTVVVTASAAPDISNTTSPTPTPKDSGSGVNKAAIAAGCVVGVLAIIAISVGAFIFLRKRRRQKIEEEYRRSAAVREYTKKPEADPRLDPGMIQRRDSVGSIADTQDYSRRILKVTNPDGQ